VRRPSLVTPKASVSSTMQARRELNLAQGLTMTIKKSTAPLPPEIMPLGRSRRGNYEILPGFNSGAIWLVYCPYSERWLSHGAGPGHRISHCLCPVHSACGYSLRYGGEMRDLLDRLPSAHRRKLAGKRERRRREVAYLQDKGQLSKFTMHFG